MSLEIYKLVHLIGVFCVLTALGALTLHAAGGGTRQYPQRRWVGMVHGIGLLLVLVAGFGMLAKLGLMSGGLPGWAFVKLGVWLALGALPALFYRKPALARQLWLATIVLAGLAAYMALFKPF